MRALNFERTSRPRFGVLLLAPAFAIGCSADVGSNQNVPDPNGAAGQGGASAGGTPTGPLGPMPGMGVMNPGLTGGTTGAGGYFGGGGRSVGGVPGFAGASVNGGQGGAIAAGGATAGGGAIAAGGTTGIGGAAPQGGAAGMAGMAGMAGGAGAPPSDGMDPTSVCAGGKVGMDSDAVTTRSLASSRNLAIVTYQAIAPNRILNFKTILTVPKTPSLRQTLFIWPGLQHSGGADPANIGNGVLQPVLTWGPSCNPNARAAGSDYSGWWISAMYVNISTGAAGPGGCAGGDAMDTPVGNRLLIDMNVNGNSWTQTVTNLDSMKKVDFTIDLKGQDQNLAIWDIEVPTSARPAADTIFEKSVLTFSSPVKTCQPGSAAEVDYFSAPVQSTDGLHCCYDKIVLKQMRN